MKRIPITCLTVFTLLSTVCQCSRYGEQHELDLTALGTVGRLWVNPNPIIFPLDQGQSPLRGVNFRLYSIGSEGVAIREVKIVRNEEFFLHPDAIIDIDILYEQGMAGREDCYDFTKLGAPMMLGENAQPTAPGELHIVTDDPTSPTLKVPIIPDPDATLPPLPTTPDGLVPLIKPNPIRHKHQTPVGETQTKQVCLRLVGGGSSNRIIRLYTIGDDLSVTEVLNDLGQSLSLPLEDQQVGEQIMQVRVSHSPQAEKREDGALVLEFEDVDGEIEVLIVPILIAD